ncbi:MAG: ACT domain-containing protein [Alistipes sp.]|nr:ACT domain-containing protein [Alistipes sp.]
MNLKKLDCDLTVCKVRSIQDIDLTKEFFFIGKTNEELSLVSITENTPENTVEREDGWKGFYIQGTLDFSLVGILSEITRILADNGISVFAVSTFNTDYVLVKKEDFEKALEALTREGGGFSIF